MEARRNLLSSSPPFFPPKPLSRNPPCSVTMLHELAAPADTSVTTTSITWHFPAYVLLQEQHEDIRSLLHIREDKTSEATLGRTEVDNDASLGQEKKNTLETLNASCSTRLVYGICKKGQASFLSQILSTFLFSQHHLFNLSNGFDSHKTAFVPILGCRLPSLPTEEKPASSMSMLSMASDTDKILHVKAHDVLALAKKAVLASKQAVYLAEESKTIEHDCEGLIPRHHKTNEVIDPTDPLQLFLSCSETKLLLTAKEEKRLFVQVQELTRIEEVKQKLQSQFGREPTLVEWAEAVGMNCGTLQLHLHSGNRSRERMIYSNFRMVAHVAKNYQGKGLSLPDLLQEGSKGLIKSLEKFKPQAGCRFSTYAYWWIRQSIRKAIFQHSRSTRLPEITADTEVETPELCVKEIS